MTDGSDEGGYLHFYTCTFYFELVNLAVFVGMVLTKVYYARTLWQFCHSSVLSLNATKDNCRSVKTIKTILCLRSEY